LSIATPVQAPDRSLDQRMAALRRANEVRTARAAIKRDLKTGRRDVRVLIAEPPPELATCKIAELIIAAPKFGKSKTDRLLRQVKVSPSRTIGGLSDRQRDDLVIRLTRRAA
jgi:hypothetical protein